MRLISGVASSDICSISGVASTGLMFPTKLSEELILAFLTASPSSVFGEPVFGKLKPEMGSSDCFGLFRA
jgi:hypothetical protein